ncbi:MAG: hypothetical protein V3U78_05855 [Thiotrichaceae bacterium]
MIGFKELYEQNHKIAELSKVLSHVIEDRSLCDTDVTCDLFFDFTDTVKDHLDVEDREIYQALLVHRESRVNNTASRFLSGSAEIKRVFKQYLRRWCHNKTLRIRNHAEFVAETNEMFELVLSRIQDEVEHLYPVVKEVALEKAA